MDLASAGLQMTLSLSTRVLLLTDRRKHLIFIYSLQGVIVLLGLYLAIFRPVWSIPWRQIPITLATVPNKLADNSADATRLSATDISKQSILWPTEVSAKVYIFEISPRHAELFCIGDRVLLHSGKQHTPGRIRLRVAASQRQHWVQFGIEITEQPWLWNSDARLSVQRLSYQSGDWLKLSC